MHLAADKGDCFALYWLHTQDPSLNNKTDKKGRTFMHILTANGFFPILEWFHEINSSLINKADYNGYTLLHVAAAKGHFVILEWLYKQNPSLFNKTDKDGFTPIHHAAFHEQISILNVFLEQIINHPSLILQIAERNCVKTLAFLLQNGLDPNKTNPPLIQIAIRAGQETNIKCLLSFGAKTEGLEETYCNLENRIKSLQLCQNHLEMWLRIFEKEDQPLIASLYYKIGIIHSSLENNDKAIENHFRALAIRGRCLGENHPDTAESYEALGALFDAYGNFFDAHLFYSKAMESYESCNPLLAIPLKESIHKLELSTKPLEVPLSQ